MNTDETLKLISMIFTGLSIFAGSFAPVFPSYTAALAAAAAACGGVSALCQKTLSSSTPPPVPNAPHQP